MIFKQKYELKDILGKGGFSQVFKVLDKKDNKFYALKFIKKNEVENIENLIENCKKEIEIMEKLKSEYVVKLKENFYDESYEGYCIVMELCDGDLRKILKNYKPNGLPLELINKIFQQLNDVLNEMLKINCIHRDLKPENILIKYKDKEKKFFDIKLTDFGLSTYEINSTIGSHSKAGTLNYCAPEIEKSHYNNKCDLWSLGVILYELYTNEYIFGSDKINDSDKIEYNRIKGIIKETDNKIINELIRKLIQVDIKKRIGWEEYFADEFFVIREYYDNGKLKFEGNHLNGERNGKGKEYNDNGKLKFLGEYLKGERNGKGIEYYGNGKLKFEGEYLNGKKWNGKIKEYYENGELKFEGEYLNGKRKWKRKRI